MKHIFIFSILFSFCATSCYTLKPDSEYATSPNYNNQVTVTKPKFVKKNNPIGISIQIATPIIAGAAMYQFAPSLVQYQSGAETKNFQPANAAIGILGMLAINKIVNYAFGYNRVKPMRSYEVDKWMKKTNLQKKYNYIAETEGYKIQLIPKTQESDFTVKTAQDVLHFKALFPLASQENIAKVIQSGTTNLSHEDLTTLVHYYPNHEAVNATKIKYIETARNYTELWDRINKYTETKVDREKLSANLIVLEKEYDNFKSKIPNSSYASTIEKNLIDIDNRSFAEFSSINSKDGYRQYLNKFLRPHNKELALQKIAEIEEEERVLAEKKRQEELAEIERRRLEAFENENAEKRRKEQYLEDWNKCKEEYWRAVQQRKGFRLVKIEFSSRDGSHLKNAYEVKDFMTRAEISYGIEIMGLSLGGNSNGEKVFEQVSNPVICMDKGVIDAVWYRSGTLKDGSMFTHNSGFEKNIRNLKNYVYNKNIRIDNAQYLGDFSDDDYKIEQERKYQQEQCDKCIVDVKKSKDPTVEEGFFGKSYYSGKILMLNGESYSWDYSKKGFRVNNGWFTSDDYHKSYNLMIIALTIKCKEQICR